MIKKIILMGVLLFLLAMIVTIDSNDKNIDRTKYMSYTINNGQTFDYEHLSYESVIAEPTNRTTSDN